MVLKQNFVDNRLLYSYDIFDTCLVRACGKASRVYDIVADWVLGTDAPLSARRDFALIRKNGETMARQTLTAQEREDVTLDDIYSFCDFSAYTNETNKSIRDIELQVEDEVLVPVYSVKKEIEAIHSYSVPIIFISDMYLPSSFLQKKLEKEGLFRNKDKIYVSCEVGKTKAKGTLYAYIKDNLGVDYKSWVHSGDDKWSDIRRPKKLGIKTREVSLSYSKYECEMANNCFESASMDVSNCASISRAVRLWGHETAEFVFASEFVAPIYVSFVHAVLEDSIKIGIRRLYFVSRDGYLPYLIAQRFSKLFPSVELRYIKLSRQSLYLPGLKELSASEIKKCFESIDRCSVVDILQVLQLSQMYTITEDYSGKRGMEALNGLLSDKHFVQILRKRFEDQKKLCTQYLIDEGLTLEGSAIVDVFGTRRCQECINNLLHEKGYPEVKAFYFQVSGYRILDGGGSYYAYNYQEKFWRSINYHPVIQTLYEQYFSMTTQKRTVAYQMEQNKISPIYEEDIHDLTYRKLIFNENLNACMAYADLYNKINIIDPKLCIRMAQKKLSSFCYLPNKNLLRAFGNFYCSNGREIAKLLPKRSLVSVILHKNSRWWVCGELVYNSRFLYPLIFVLLKIRRKIMIWSQPTIQ